MYFTGDLSIDPAHATKIESKKPSKVFGKLFYYLTAGSLSEKEEHETFTAVSILQQLNTVMRSLGINNIVRLSQDDHDFYLDESGREDDLQEAMEEFEITVDPILSEVFKTLYMVLEHEDDHLKYLIEIQIKRKHKVGEYPIAVQVNGVIRDMRLQAGEDQAALKKRMEGVFSAQDNYERFVNSRRAAFDSFVNELDQSIRKFIRVDDIKRKTDSAIIRPKKPVAGREEIRRSTDMDAAPVYHGYHGIGDYFFYAWMWSSMSHSHNIHIHNVNVVDEAGNTMMEVGEQGFDAGDSNALNPEESFEPPQGEDISFNEGHEFDQEFSDASVSTGDDASVLSASADSGDSGDSDSGSWFDSFGFGGGDSDSGGSSCSSCSSCGGCGGD